MTLPSSTRFSTERLHAENGLAVTLDPREIETKAVDINEARAIILSLGCYTRWSHRLWEAPAPIESTDRVREIERERGL
jgi:hypothetical protein